MGPECSGAFSFRKGGSDQKPREQKVFSVVFLPRSGATRLLIGAQIRGSCGPQNPPLAATHVILGTPGCNPLPVLINDLLLWPPPSVPWARTSTLPQWQRGAGDAEVDERRPDVEFLYCSSQTPPKNREFSSFITPSEPRPIKYRWFWVLLLSARRLWGSETHLLPPTAHADSLCGWSASRLPLAGI